MLTCKKTYTDIPFGHRQHRHDGHCAMIHGHNWSFTITFGCTQTDENGFVVDFGKLKYLKKWIEENLDHACLFNIDDPLRDQIISAVPQVWKPYLLPDCSSEGIAQHLYSIFNPLVVQQTGGRAFIVAIQVAEDSKNSATFTPDNCSVN
jgi:6-pyruvoyltetrahydropterin/6-carboxytetrahydropterin synthase